MHFESFILHVCALLSFPEISACPGWRETSEPPGIGDVPGVRLPVIGTLVGHRCASSHSYGAGRLDVLLWSWFAAKTASVLPDGPTWNSVGWQVEVRHRTVVLANCRQRTSARA